MSDTPEWRAMTFAGLIYGIYRLPGMPNWRYLREGGERKTFKTEKDARDAARERALAILFPKIHSTNAPDEKRVAESLDVEGWLRTKRKDVQAARKLHRKGKRTVLVVNGKVAS